MHFYFWQPGSDEPGTDHELIWGGVGLFVLAVARLVPPGLTNWYKCPFHSMTGIPCLTCGMTRSFRHVVRLEFADAFSLCPLGAVLCLLTLAYLLYAVTLVLFRLPRPRVCLESSAARWTLRLGLPAIFLINWIYLFYHDV